MSNIIATSLDQTVGTKFMNVSNQDLLDMTRNLTSRLDDTGSVKILGNDLKMTAIATLPKFAFNDSNDGALFPRIHITNDNRGGSALRVSVGLFRLICTNGLAVGVPGASFIHKVSHIFTENQKQKILDIPMVAESVIDYINSGALQEQIDEARSVKIVDPVSVIGNLDIGIRAKDQSVAQILLGRFRKEDDPTNAWGLYNLVNENVRLRSRNELIALNKDEGMLEDIMALAA